MGIINKLLFAGGAVVVVAFFFLMLSNAHLKTKLAQEQARETACLMANDAFEAQVVQQNKAIARIKSDSALREKRARDAADEAQEKARLFYIAADALRKTKLRGDTCKAADKLLNAYVGDNK